MIKTLDKLGIEGMCLNKIKATYKKPTANIILNGEKNNAFPLRLEIRKRCPFLPFLLNIRIGSFRQLRKKKWKVKSCPTLCDPMDCSLPGSSVHGIFQARVLEWTAISFSRGIFPTQGSNPGIPHCRQMLYCPSHQGSHQGETKKKYM